MASTITKKLGQLKQWTGEKFGSTERTNTSEEFRRLQIETETRREGIEIMHISLTEYAKTLDKKGSKSKTATPIIGLGKAMIQQGRLHGEDSVYGSILLRVGECEDAIGIHQLEFASRIRQGLLFDLADLQASLKSYKTLQKKFENRRLDYDAKQNKLHKSRKDKPQLEDEVRMAEFKYEETLKDLENVMANFNRKEETVLAALVSFAEAQMDYYKDAFEAMESLKTFLSNDELKARIQLKKESFASQTFQMPMRSISSGSVSLAYDKNASRDSLLSSEATALTLSSDMTNNTSNLSRRKSISTKSDKSTTVSMGAISNKSRDPLPPPPYTPNTTLVELFKVRALYDFTAENDNELSIAKGDVIRVLSKIDDGWWTGELEGTNLSGMFPANYVEKITAANKEKAIPKPVQSYSADSIGLNNGRSAENAGGSLQSQKAKMISEKLKNTCLQSQTTIGACAECGCDDFSPNVFKAGHCNICFHKH